MRFHSLCMNCRPLWIDSRPAILLCSHRRIFQKQLATCNTRDLHVNRHTLPAILAAPPLLAVQIPKQRKTVDIDL